MAMLSLVAGVIGMVGQFAQAQQQKKMYEYNAKIAEMRGEWEAGKSEKRTKYLRGRQRTLYGAAGMALGEGSPLEMMSWQAGEGWKEAEMIRRGASATAQQQRAYGQSAYSRGMWGGVSSFLSGATTAYGQYRQYGSIW